MSKSRQRGRLLTDSGLQRIDAALQAHAALRQQQRYSLEAIAELAVLDPSTVAKIMRRNRGVDQKTLQQLFQAFELSLQPADSIRGGSEESLEETGGPLETQRPPLAVDPSLVGREQEFAEFHQILAQGQNLILIHARGGVGKSRLAWEYIKQFKLHIPLWMAQEATSVTSIEGIVEEWLRHYFDEQPGREFGISLERLLLKMRDYPHPIGILIDNLEPALDESGRFLPQHRQYAELLRRLAVPNSNVTVLITSREVLREELPIYPYKLQHLTLRAWKTFFEQAGITYELTGLSRIHNMYAGNAKAMAILSLIIRQDCRGQLSQYIQQLEQGDRLIERPLRDLVVRQFDRLQAQNPYAYRLLCRLGGFRYQAVPSISRDRLLKLLWDVPDPEDRQMALEALQDRALLETGKGEFWLHPVIRAEAIRRLKAEGSWPVVNRRVAEIWTESVQTVLKTKDALRALEAYYHYVEVEDYLAAAQVLLQTRPNCWKTNESLGRSLYKRGLVTKITPILEQLQQQLPPSYLLAKIKQILGATYWMADEITKANALCEESIAIAQQLAYQPDIPPEISFLLKRIEMNALLTRGICELGRYDLALACDLHCEALKLAKELDPRYPKAVMFYLGYAKSATPEFHAEARQIVDQLYSEIQSLEERELPSWVTEYRLFYLGLAYKNLGHLERARDIYTMMIALAERSPYIQAKAKALSGLAELYRDEQKFDQAVLYHTDAVKLLSQIATTCDLAEAYFQFALTYQSQGNLDQAWNYFERSRDLFGKVGAPRQLERINLAMRPELKRRHAD